MITEKLGLFYLGKNEESDEPLFIKSQDLTTHALILGMTGSGKTGLGIALLEEAGIDGVPSLIVDPKGDLADLKLRFPSLQGSDFLPWMDPLEAEKKGETVSQLADDTAKAWKEGLEKSLQGPERLKRLQEGVECEIYTPGSASGRSLSLLSRLDPPGKEVMEDGQELREIILSTVSSLLGLAGVESDPAQGVEHILLSTLIEEAWRRGESLDLPKIIQAIQRPSFTKVGVFDLETFMPAKERLKLAMRFNNLVASPAFQSWMEGEPLDIQSLLWTQSGKPRMAILSIAHLGDKERMFFVTLLLNRLIGWMRKQTGTSSLRALFYMDEIFGYFPPTSAPPSKLPMLTLLKQARAFGLGVVLSTQNPIDLDYKGLANVGTWMIGRLQTENDKKRLLDGLQEMGRKELDEKVSSLQKREFILKSPSNSKLERFFTRWTLSYLKGPLTLTEIARFYPKAAARAILEPESEGVKFQPTSEIKELFSPDADLSKPLQGSLLGFAKLHYIDKKRGVDLWKDVAISAPIKECALWDEGEEIEMPLSAFKNEAPVEAKFAPLPEVALNAARLKEEKGRFEGYLYRKESLDLFSVPSLKLESSPQESERDFKARLSQILREKRDEAIKKLEKSHEAAYSKLQAKLSDQQIKQAKQEEQVGRQKFDTYVSIGSTLIGALLGQKRGAIDKAGVAARRAARIGKEENEAALGQTKVNTLQAEMEALSQKMKEEAAIIDEQFDPNKVEVSRVEIPPRKSDIAVEGIYLLWK